MERIAFGRTGKIVSRLGFGGAPAGLTNYLADYNPHDSAHRRGVQHALETALTLGITYFDTAPGYGNGASEQIFGEVLAHAREDIFVATKLNRDVTDVRASVETSLHRLGRPHIDLLQIHGTSFTPQEAAAFLEPGGMVEQMEALRTEGLIRHLGFTSEDNNPPVYGLIESDRFDCMQIAYNLLHQHPYEPTRPFGSLLAAQARQMGVCTMRARTSGIFQRWVQLVNPENSFDYGQALLQFVFSNPLVHVVLVGMRTAEEVRSNVAIAQDLGGRIDIDELHRKYPADVPQPRTDKADE